MRLWRSYGKIEDSKQSNPHTAETVYFVQEENITEVYGGREWFGIGFDLFKYIFNGILSKIKELNSKKATKQARVDTVKFR